ncbi:MAG: hypothetical protein IJH12_02165 [Clostridia bacterium]|nr:hypothetical protein [Clostridia bacterium]
MKNFVKIMENVENLVKGCEGYVEYGFIPDENVVSVRVFEYDDYAEYCDDLEYYNFTLVFSELFEQIKTQCNDLAENIKSYVPTDADKMCYGYFNYREILITPRD